MSITLPLVNRRYALLDEVGRGGMGIVYRAIDRLSGQNVALKRIRGQQSPANAFMSTGAGNDQRFLLAREFQALASLWHPHIIGVLDYGFEDDQQPFFTMELLEDAHTILAAGEGKPLDEQIGLLVQMLQALRYLHRRRVLHRDLKPSNVLAVGSHVKMLDFGLSVSDEDAKALTGTLGTLAYLAPEVMSGGPASVASDLYAAGVIMYQLFTGHHPFDTSTITRLIDQVNNKIPDLSGLAPRLAAIVGRLLAKQPEDRYPDAGTVIEALGEAISTLLPLETSATRESFLQAARFVGRQDEMRRFEAGLDNLFAGTGGTWLVGGESGVGKSRLLNELRTVALVKGVNVLRGQSEVGGATPYQVWREAVRWLVLSGGPTEDLAELDAQVLKTIVPDIAALLRLSPVADPPPLDPTAARNRLFDTVERLIRRQKRALLIILEDLHNAGTESLALLAWLARAAPGLALMIVGSYRDEEKPELPTIVPDAQTIRLARLSEAQVAELGETMLGKGGGQPEIIELLQRETEGNAYFLVEVVRALAEEAGDLDAIGEKTVPAHVFAGGVQQIIERRVNRVSAEDRTLLEIAAVMGRIIDLDLLARAAQRAPKVSPAVGNPQVDDAWLTRCSNAAVLEVQGGQWRFAHDKLREHLMAELASTRRPALHHAVAQALEGCYGENDSDQAAALYLHWSAAGDVTKTQRYTALAGQHASRISANIEAIQYFERALALETRQTPSDERRYLRAAWTRGIGEAYNGMGDQKTAIKKLREALSLLGFPEPEGRRGITRSLLLNFFVQVGHRARRLSGTETTDPFKAEAARTHRQLAEVYYFANDVIFSLHSTLVALNFAEQNKVSPELAQSYSGLVVAAGYVGRHKWARGYARRALDTAAKLDDPLVAANVRQRIGLYLIAVGQWAEARQTFEEGDALYARIGEGLARSRSLSALFAVLKYQGELARALQVATTNLEDGKRRGDLFSIVSTLTGMAGIRLRMGDLEQAIRLCQQALDEVTKRPNITVELRATAIMAAAWARTGEHRLAFDAAARNLKTLETFSSGLYAMNQAYHYTLEALLGVWEADPGAGGDYQPLAERAHKAQAKFVRRFYFARPMLSQNEGQLAWLRGEKDKAMAAWQKSLAVALELKMPYEQAVALSHMGRYGGNAAELEEARRIFAQIGAKREG
jgi:tetratricopeptide (TPR) repeat protein